MSGGVSGSALEWALALLHAPGERYVLRLRSLPPEMETLLAVAAEASPEALAENSRKLGEPEGRIREAARFYAREVLFHPDADAYRTLGVAPEASPEQIKLHHRLLQHWLHPDRQRSEDDSVFAARVNTAWNELRNQKRRTAYDETLREKQMAYFADPHLGLVPGPAARRSPGWVQLEEYLQPSHGWRHRLPVLALLGVCVLLGWLAIRDGQREPAAWDWKDGGVRVAQVDTPDGDKSQVGPARAGALAAAPRLAHSIPTHSIAPPAPATRPSQSPARRVAAIGPPPPAKRVAAIRPPPPAKSIAAISPPPSSLPIAPAAPATAKSKSPAAGAVIASNGPPAAAIKVAKARQPAGKALARLSPSPQVVAAVTPASAPSAPSAPAPDFARITQARQVGSQLLQYFRKIRQPPPPIWNSPAIMSSAGGMRTALYDQGQATLYEPQWRINATSATMTTAFHAGDTAASMRGVLAVDMVWREDHWLVTGVSMEHAQ
jgi:hypothetical protein